MNVPAFTLNDVQTIYSFWGNYPFFYGIVTFFTFLGRETFFRRQTVKLLNLDVGGTVLDVACGTGRNFSFLKKAVGAEGAVIGFDYSQDMLKAAELLIRRKQWQNMLLVQGDAAELKLPDKNIDGALSVLGISAVPDYRSAIQRVKDILKPGGIFVVCDATLFDGVWRVLNPFIKPLYRQGAAWNPERDIPGAMKKVFGNVMVERYLGRAFFIAYSIK